MSISATCQNGHTLKVKDGYAGQRGKCPKCGAIVLIPAITQSYERPAKDRPNTTPPNKQPAIDEHNKPEHCPKVLAAHRVFSVLMVAIGILFTGIGLTLISKRSAIAEFNRSHGVIHYRSSEQERAELYVGAGLTYATLYFVGFMLPRKKVSYLYLTVLLPLGLWNVIGIVFAPVLCIWWFRRENRTYFGFQ